MITTEAIRELEERLHNPAMRRNRHEVASLLTPDFKEFGSSGQIYDRSTVLAALEAETTAENLLHGYNYHLHYQSDETVLLTYISEISAPDGTVLTRSLRSSLWIMHKGHWKMQFHQGTKISPL